MVHKFPKDLERVIMRFDAGAAGLAATAEATALLLSAAPTLTFILAGTAVVFGTMALIDSNKLRRLKRAEEREIQQIDKPTIQETKLLKRK